MENKVDVNRLAKKMPTKEVGSKAKPAQAAKPAPVKAAAPKAAPAKVNPPAKAPSKSPVKAPAKELPKPAVKPQVNRFNKETVKKAALNVSPVPSELQGLGTPHLIMPDPLPPPPSPVLTLKDLGTALEKLELSMAKRLAALESEFRMSRGMVKHEVRCTKCAGNRPLIKDKKKLLEALKNDGATFVASEVRLLLP